MAGAAAGDLAAPAAQARERVPVRAAGADVGDLGRDRREAVHARPALPRGLARQPGHDPRHLGHRAGRLRQGDDDARAERQAPARERRRPRARSDAARVAVDPACRGSRRRRTARAARSAPPARPAGRRARVPDARSRARPGGARTPSRVTSVEPGWSAGPSARNHPGPWRAISARCASVSVFCTSVGLRFSPRSDGRGGVRVGFGARPSERPQQRGLLAAEERVGHAGDAGCGGRSSRSRERRIDGRVRVDAGVRDRHHDRCPRRRRRPRRHRAVEHEVRRALEQDAVLDAHRLALGAVDDDDPAPAAGGHAAQLDRRGEQRAAAAAQRRPARPPRSARAAQDAGPNGAS